MPRTLIVEDDLDLHSILEAVIRPFGMEAHCVTSVEEARERLSNERYDLILCDQNLSGMLTGIEFWNFCRMNYPFVPFMLMSAAPHDVFDSLVEMGIRCPPFLVKPFALDEGRKIVGEVLKDTRVTLT